MKIVCSVCERVMGHKAPYEDHRESHTYCGQCFSIMQQCDFNYYIEYIGGKAIIRPHKPYKRYYKGGEKI